MRGVDSLCVAQSRDKWRDIVNMVMNHCIPLHAGNIFEYLVGL
jgi:hypothetical protein